MNNLEFEYVVVGGGITGGLLSFALSQAGYKTLLFHESVIGEATSISSGLINPVTGMRFVKTWNYENIIPVALSTYRKLENYFNSKLVYHHNMIVELNSIEEENNWHSRMAEEEYKSYCKLFENKEHGNYNLSMDKSYGLLQNVIRIDLPLVCDLIIKKLAEDGATLNEEFYFHLLNKTESGFTYDSKFTFRKIIFCEGFRVNQNPYFSWLPIVKLKGERILAESKIRGTEMLHSKYTMTPMNNLYWIGSNYSLTDPSFEITLEEANSLSQFTKENLREEFTVVNQSFGFRPSSRDRRPIIGVHPLYSNLYIVNGLGAKGASLAPYCTDLLVRNLIDGIELPNEVCVKRFVKKGYMFN